MLFRLSETQNALCIGENCNETIRKGCPGVADRRPETDGVNVSWEPVAGSEIKPQQPAFSRFFDKSVGFWKLLRVRSTWGIQTALTISKVEAVLWQPHLAQIPMFVFGQETRMVLHGRTQPECMYVLTDMRCCKPRITEVLMFRFSQLTLRRNTGTPTASCHNIMMPGSILTRLNFTSSSLFSWSFPQHTQIAFTKMKSQNNGLETCLKYLSSPPQNVHVGCTRLEISPKKCGFGTFGHRGPDKQSWWWRFVLWLWVGTTGRRQREDIMF